MNKIKIIFNLFLNMGWKYFSFRIKYEFLKKTGILKRKFPSSFPEITAISVHEWHEYQNKSIFNSKENYVSFQISQEAKENLNADFNQLICGKFKFFSSIIYDLGNNYDWITNPDTNYKYSILTHWTKIPDFNPEFGDIKYVWEKSRFSYIYTIIRYDYHFKSDQSKLVIDSILDWIDKNPLNYGPNYVCSQEISLRIINWSFALAYYRNSEHLNQTVLNTILNSIYGQACHVRDNINFSRIAVRNNHAITECFLLFFIGVQYPYFPKSNVFFKMGKKLLNEEILYQIYDDGSYLQHSFNYQRVVVQVLTLYTLVCKKNKITIQHEVLKKMNQCLLFLQTFTNKTSGELPNYGNNDGALFFPLNGCEFRNYLPQLNNFSFALNNEVLTKNIDTLEDVFWLSNEVNTNIRNDTFHTINKFEQGGYYSVNEEDALTMLRCNSFTDRPAHADNLHIDIWHKQTNILRDNGSYKYNTSSDKISFFMGTSSHNTVQIENYDQMLKGGRFIWYYWSERTFANLTENGDKYIFSGEIIAYKQLKKQIKHYRKVSKTKNKLFWEIEDKINNCSYKIAQLWHIHPDFFNLGFDIQSFDSDGIELPLKRKKGYFSSHYGKMEETEVVYFESNQGYFKTIIKHLD